MRRFLLSFSLCLLLGTLPVQAEQPTVENVQLTLPPAVYAVPESEVSLYFQNIVLYEPASDLQFKVTCDVGEKKPGRWIFEPDADDVGDYPLTLSVQDKTGNEIVSAKTVVHVAPRDAGAGQDLRLLIIGDSLTQASHYPNQIHTLSARPENPSITMLGTHQPSNALPEVVHEGYGGWTWHSFLSRYIPADKSDGTYRTKSSPFLKLNEEGKPTLDVQYFIDEHADGVAPDVVIFKLGINDAFRVNAADPDAQIDVILSRADQLVDEFKKVTPNAKLGICLTTPGNGREEAFEANYKDKYPRRGWKQIQHRLVQRYIEHFDGRESENISLIPTELNLDILDGYPHNNAVHPNKVGYEQIGTTIYAWLKYELAQSPSPAE
ncbi:GDSL-like Lipase/Acylhydrolase [Polystyrenella longa]|uniref:GDSL-like Lipase/Acylhydrolase n=1 Tax=Polystyrenella longa TaxID=2528007 RepID=A0A518CJA8_9PLAN|nr:SGNH/GDSL hydrolase family protein [Polystyrenella longa]QDU79315.1 GDSL-like Lipase/Acylhydrolase [Polystyrenella longa]